MVMVCLGLATCMASTIDIEYLCFHLFIKVWGGGVLACYPLSLLPCCLCRDGGGCLFVCCTDPYAGF